MPDSRGFENTEVSTLLSGHVCMQLSNKSSVGRLIENKNMLPLPGIEKTTLQLKLKKKMHMKIPAQQIYTEIHSENTKAIKANSREITKIFPWTNNKKWFPG